MIIGDYFSTPIGEFRFESILPKVDALFEKHKDKFINVETHGVAGVETTLKRYDAGWWNESFIDLLKDPDTEELRNFILVAASKFAYEIGYSLDGIELYIENMWMNKMTKGALNHRHHHSAIFSGCYYVATTDLSTPIIFWNPETVRRAKLPVRENTRCNTNMVEFKPKPGDMLLWESHVDHEVKRQTDDRERRVVAFDITARWK